MLGQTLGGGGGGGTECKSNKLNNNADWRLQNVVHRYPIYIYGNTYVYESGVTDTVEILLEVFFYLQQAWVIQQPIHPHGPLLVVEQRLYRREKKKTHLNKNKNYGGNKE